jgi:hypothetical protein
LWFPINMVRILQSDGCDVYVTHGIPWICWERLGLIMDVAINVDLCGFLHLLLDFYLICGASPLLPMGVQRAICGPMFRFLCLMRSCYTGQDCPFPQYFVQFHFKCKWSGLLINTGRTAWVKIIAGIPFFGPINTHLLVKFNSNILHQSRIHNLSFQNRV